MARFAGLDKHTQRHTHLDWKCISRLMRKVLLMPRSTLQCFPKVLEGTKGRARTNIQEKHTFSKTQIKYEKKNRQEKRTYLIEAWELNRLARQNMEVQ